MTRSKAKRQERRNNRKESRQHESGPAPHQTASEIIADLKREAIERPMGLVDDILIAFSSKRQESRQHEPGGPGPHKVPSEFIADLKREAIERGPTDTPDRDWPIAFSFDEGLVDDILIAMVAGDNATAAALIDKAIEIEGHGPAGELLATALEAVDGAAASLVVSVLSAVVAARLH